MIAASHVVDCEMLIHCIMMMSHIVLQWLVLKSHNIWDLSYYSRIIEISLALTTAQSAIIDSMLSCVSRCNGIWSDAEAERRQTLPTAKQWCRWCWRVPWTVGQVCWWADCYETLGGTFIVHSKMLSMHYYRIYFCLDVGKLLSSDN